MRRGDERDALRLMRQHGGGEGHPLFHVGAGLVELVRDGLLDGLGQFGLVHHHLTDKNAVTLLGGDAARGGVRLAQVAHLGEGGHFVADGGRTKIEVVALHQPLRADRLRGLDVIADDEDEKSLLAVG